MNKMTKLMLMFAAFCAVATVAHAQGGSVSSGCGNSPENPTAILALVGSGSGFLMALRSKLRRNK